MNNTPTLEALVARLETVKGRWPELAEVSDVPISTLRKVAQGVVVNPGITTVEKLWVGLRALPKIRQ